MESFIGLWRLCSWSALWAYEFEGTVDEFLYQEAAAPFPRTDDFAEAHGSSLTIDRDGAFVQAGRGEAPLLTYDECGIQVSGVAEFDGVIHEDRGIGYLLRREVPAWAAPKDPFAPPRLRWDDGDTKVCDSIQLRGRQLVRTMCVVTDECYGDRVMLVYER